MLEIVKSSEFNARAVKPIDIKNKIPGYNFSYPVLNTIDICNILMLGGSIEISIERMGKSKWSYNLDTKELTIEKPTSTERHMIIDTTELIFEMDKYFNQNKDVLWKNTYKTNIKKSMSKKVKKNAQKSETSSSKKSKLSIDETEFPYLRVLLDEIFGRNNFIGTFIWQKKKGGGNDSRYIAIEHEYIVCVAKNIEQLPDWHTDYDEDYLKRYSEEDEHGKYFWDTLARPGLKNPIIYDITAPDGTIITNGWVRSKKRFEEDLANGAIRITKKNDGKWSVQFKQYMGKGKKPRSLLVDVAINSDAKQEMLKLFGDDKAFPYPKPEKLICYILNLFTNPGDLVLDSFLGSGTTAAVAHKMGRRWIGIEMGDHVYTHCLPRLKRVINGEDAGGVTKSTGWLCGGGFKFYELASSLIVKDKYGQQIISDKYNADMLAEAMCKILGYHYKPDSTAYWKQGYSSEKSFIYTTTFSMQEASLERLHEEVGDNNLLVCCSAFSGNSKAYPNISVKKIPAAILKKCEWGREGYPLNLTNYHPDDKEFEFDEENDE